ncbi:uncharacterized protein QC763_502020 [Podospora pseudopauciseta]|uniref:LysM domain-containing protein n=1 Tax=Podospora pseudopauciseta TaxID=2093780 RepID=A0ABR0H747_9PEZI|nr:hypothetical protein QC763_502020 [Podospora pseudopauciseta]
MRWTQFCSSLIAGFLATTSLAATWERDVWAPTFRVGGKGGSEFELLAETGQTVQKIRVFRVATTKNKRTLRGIQVTFSDGATRSAGALEGESKDYHFQPGEAITEMTLWGNGDGKRTGRILFKTTIGGEFDHGQETTGQGNFVMEVGSGMLIGFVGRAGKEMDQLSPVFIRKLAKDPVLEDVRIDSYNPFANLELETLSTKKVKWDGVAHNWSFGDTIMRSTSTTWTTSSSTSLTFGMSIKAGIPDVVSVETSVSWSTSSSSSQSTTQSKDKTLTWSLGGRINSPEEAVDCTAQVWSGNLNIGWDGVLVLDTGVRVYRIPTRGTLKRVDVSEVISQCSPLYPELVRPGSTQPAVQTPTPTPTGFITVTTTSLSTPSSSPSTGIKPQPGTVENCAEFHKVVAGDTCHDIAQGAGITLDEFYALNKKVTIDFECDNLYRGYHVCVGLAA